MHVSFKLKPPDQSTNYGSRMQGPNSKKFSKLGSQVVKSSTLKKVPMTPNDMYTSNGSAEKSAASRNKPNKDLYGPFGS